jgi:hypothetical protein
VTPEPPITVYIAIGNDTSLSPVQWAKYASMAIEEMVRAGGRVLADWYSLPNAHWQGQCFCVEIQPGIVDRLQETLTDVARGFGQPRITWAVAPETVYLG